MAAALTLAAYLPLLAAGALWTWRRPVVALYAFAVGLAAHNLALALLYGAGVEGRALTAVQGWKEALLATALARVTADAARARRLPFRAGVPDVLAGAFALVATAYALVPQGLLGGSASRSDALYALRHALLPVAAYALGRSLGLDGRELRRLAWVVVGTAAAVAGLGLVELWTVPVERWRDAGVPAYYRDVLGFHYTGPGGMPENFAFNSGGEVHRRLVSTFVSPLASAYLLAVALLLLAAGGPFRRRVAVPLAALCAAGLLFTLSRSTLLALAGGFVVLAAALGRRAPLAAAAGTLAAGVAFALAFTSVAPRTHFFPDELRRQEENARRHGGVPGSGTALNPGEPSLRSHLSSLRDGIRTVARHPQGYGMGNAGAVAQRRGVPLKAGESNYTELGVDAGVAGAALWVTWSLALLLALLRAARSAAPAARWAPAAVAASLAVVLALAVQADALGTPWLAYCLWWLAGGLAAVRPLRQRAREGAPAQARPRELPSAP